MKSRTSVELHMYTYHTARHGRDSTPTLITHAYPFTLDGAVGLGCLSHRHSAYQLRCCITGAKGAQRRCAAIAKPARDAVHSVSPTYDEAQLAGYDRLT